MEKKIYEKPVAQEERFVPNHYAAACPGVTEWQATCRNESCLIFFDDGNYTSDANRGGCGGTHKFTIEEGALPTANCWLLKNVRTREPGVANAWNSEYDDWFSEKGTYDGVGWVLNPDKIAELKSTDQLVRGYYNDNVLPSQGGHGGSGHAWLVTDDLWSIKPHS